MTGIYVILAELNESADIRMGKGRRVTLGKGFYAYVGSALGGLEKRVERHLGAEKKLHWHIDYLLEKAAVRMVICAETGLKEECFVARGLSAMLSSVPGFGSTDCRCPSHLLFSSDLETLKEHALHVLRSRGLRPYLHSLRL